MLNLISSIKLIVIFSLIFFLLVTGIIHLLPWLGFEGISDSRVAFSLASIFELALLYLFSVGWRKLWSWIPKLNDWIFPDLNGKWDAEITWNWNGKTGIKKGSVLIKQSLTKFSVNLDTDESESSTLMVKPFKDSESDQAAFYYIYRAESKDSNPKNKNKGHTGAAILKINMENSRLMSGNYFTDRESFGRYVFTRV